MALIGVILTAVIALAVWHPWTKSPDQKSGKPTVSEAPQQQKTAVPSEKDYPKLVDMNFEGICVTGAENMGGVFVEDGSDKAVDSVFTAAFQNNTGKTLQFAELNLGCGGQTYTFDISVLPPAAKVIVQEKNRKICTEKEGSWSISATYSPLWFENEPLMYENLFSVTGKPYSIAVKNETSADVKGPIHVCYKRWDGNYYIGGIAYRKTLEKGLLAGESVNLYDGHYDPDRCRWMFVDYVS